MPRLIESSKTIGATGAIDVVESRAKGHHWCNAKRGSGACLLAGSGARRFALKDGLAGWKAWARPVTGHPPGLPDDGFRSIRHGSRPRVESEAFQAWAWSHLNCPPKAHVSKERGK